jgi:pyrroline-5-carboxylate reductase
MTTQGAEHFPASLLLIGAGKMGGAMLDGWLALGLNPHHVNIIEPAPDAALAALCLEKGMTLGAPSAPPDALILAIKPQMLDAASPDILPLVSDKTLVLSILAGKTLGNLEARFGAAKAIVRAMPNLPASIGRGVTGAIANKAVAEAQRKMADALLSAVGSVEWLSSEDQIDALTAISGCGPAYVFYLVECLAAAAVDMGLPADLAARLARVTIEGSGELLAQSVLPPDQLRRNVTSPGGVTAAALDVLMAEKGLSPLIRDVVVAAKRRAAELAG